MATWCKLYSNLFCVLWWCPIDSASGGTHRINIQHIYPTFIFKEFFKSQDFFQGIFRERFLAVLVNTFWHQDFTWGNFVWRIFSFCKGCNSSLYQRCLYLKVWYCVIFGWEKLKKLSVCVPSDPALGKLGL